MNPHLPPLGPKGTPSHFNKDRHPISNKEIAKILGTLKKKLKRSKKLQEEEKKRKKKWHLFLSSLEDLLEEA